MKKNDAIRVLVIDEDEVLRGQLVAHLEAMDYRVSAAPDAQTGLALFREDTPDVVLTELILKGTPANELLAALQAHASEVPIIVVSAHNVMSDVVAALQQGALDYLLKPLNNLTVVEEVIHKAVEHGGLLRSNQTYQENLEATNRQLRQSLKSLEEDQIAGRQIQFQLLPPKECQIGKYYFTHHIIPSLYLSGDFIDYFSIDENLIGFYIIDVSGHGASSAFVTVLVKSLISQWRESYHTGQDDTIEYPDKLLALLGNELLSSNLGKYLTMFYGVIDQARNTLTYSIGGQYPQPILSDGKKANFLANRSFPVGLAKDTQYDVVTRKLPEQFTMAMFSDGIFDVMSADTLEDKEAQLLEMVHDPKITMEMLLTSIVKAKQQVTADDITVGLIRRMP